MTLGEACLTGHCYRKEGRGKDIDMDFAFPTVLSATYLFGSSVIDLGLLNYFL